jgi:hypothetical protein
LLGGRRGAPWLSETFVENRMALKFQALMPAANGGRTAGSRASASGRALTMLSLRPNTRCSTSARRTYGGSRALARTQTKYIQQLTYLNDWLTRIKHIAPTVENVTTSLLTNPHPTRQPDTVVSRGYGDVPAVWCGSAWPLQADDPHRRGREHEGHTSTGPSSWPRDDAPSRLVLGSHRIRRKA